MNSLTDLHSWRWTLCPSRDANIFIEEKRKHPTQPSVEAEVIRQYVRNSYGRRLKAKTFKNSAIHDEILETNALSQTYLLSTWIPVGSRGYHGRMDD
jgi:hypothetical protein